MKKPLLLLVDDDRAVLEALESELGPAFADICRLEALDDPRAVLGALPRWTEERRSIALAIVDQKMAEMAGVELLVALRRGASEPGPSPASTGTGTPGASAARAEEAAAAPPFHPARHMRAVLLTGYAGLDSAIAAKNEAGVNRYIEKPWGSQPLAAAVRAGLSTWIQESGAGRHYVFREARTEGEIRALLRLRFGVYCSTNQLTRSVLPEGHVALDVDAYDSVSRQFCLMERQHDGEAVVGSLRVVEEESSPAAALLQSVLQPHPALVDRLHGPRAHPLPLMKYLLDWQAVEVLVNRVRRAGERVVEPGRLALDPAYRAGATGPRHLARHMIEGSVAFFFFFRIEHAVLTCAPPHAAFYEPYGFRPAEGTSTRLHPELSSLISCLHGSIPWVPAPARERCQSLAARIARTGGACRCGTFPHCLGGPYETGEFRASDLFCPLLAAERLGAEGGGARPR